ncbi:MAG: lipopolysaccharide kinase InaA family protein [Muribaculaceae bacterium]|nr:lipopolysaccharide kinase InaA family protein [Muribaculaceae bacterium]
MKPRLLYKITDTDSDTADCCSDIFRNGTDSDARQIYRGARNTLYDVTAKNGRHLCVKHFRKAKFPNSYIYTTLRHSKARRSFEHAVRLLDLGFSTPRPIAWSERRKGLKLLDSYYICEYLDLPNIRDWGKMPDADRLTDALGKFMVELHRAGIYHRDFSPGNILVDRPDGGGYRFYLVDINRMSFGVTDRKKLMSMFRSISLDPADTERLARAYAKASGDDSDTIAAEAIASLNDYQATKRRHRRWKRLLGKK